MLILTANMVHFRSNRKYGVKAVPVIYIAAVDCDIKIPKKGWETPFVESATAKSVTLMC